MMTKRNISFYLIIISIVFACIAIVVFPKWIVDDAFIVFRYADNLVHYGQLNWNPGNDPVEGYTGIALPLLIAGAVKAGIPPIIMTHAIGVISFIAGGIFLFLLLRLIKISGLVTGLITLLYSTIPVLYTHIFSGLETMLFTSAIIIVMYYSLLLLHGKYRQKKYHIILNLLLVFLSLIRPEGVILGIMLILFIALYMRGMDKKQLRNCCIYAFIFFILPFTAYFLWRWSYYGYLFPNTYYLKTGNGAFNFASFSSLSELVEKYFGIPFIIGLFLLLIDIDKVWESIKKDEVKIISKEFLTILLAVIIFSAILILKYVNTDLLMNYSNRFYVPLIPAFLIVLAVFLDIGGRNLKKVSVESPMTYKVYIAGICFLLIFQTGKIVNGFKHEYREAAGLRTLIENVHIQAGKYIHDHFNKDYTLLIHADAGAIPYYSGLKTIDFGGLNDEYLSHRSSLNKHEMVDYFFKVNADILVITSFKSDKIERKAGSLNWETLEMTINDPRFKQYSNIKTFSTPTWHNYQMLFVRNDILNNSH